MLYKAVHVEEEEHLLLDIFNNSSRMKPPSESVSLQQFGYCNYLTNGDDDAQIPLHSISLWTPNMP